MSRLLERLTVPSPDTDPTLATNSWMEPDHGSCVGGYYVKLRSTKDIGQVTQVSFGGVIVTPEKLNEKTLLLLVPNGTPKTTVLIIATSNTDIFCAKYCYGVVNTTARIIAQPGMYLLFYQCAYPCCFLTSEEADIIRQKFSGEETFLLAGSEKPLQELFITNWKRIPNHWFPLRVVVYCRVSVDRAITLGHQVGTVLSFLCEHPEYALEDLLVDYEQRASNLWLFNRRSGMLLFAVLCRKRNVSIILVPGITRLWKQIADMKYGLCVLAYFGVCIVCRVFYS